MNFENVFLAKITLFYNYQKLGCIIHMMYDQISITNWEIKKHNCKLGVEKYKNWVNELTRMSHVTCSP